jgi:uncharacterized coiled-coil DUF342 family protein
VTDPGQLRKHLDEAHKQLLERDTEYRFSEERIRQLEAQLAETQEWARELEAQLQEMQSTRAWRLAVRLRSLKPGSR